MLHRDKRRDVLRAEHHPSDASCCEKANSFSRKKSSQKGFSIPQKQPSREVSPQDQHTEADMGVAQGGQAIPQCGCKTLQSCPRGTGPTSTEDTRLGESWRATEPRQRVARSESQ